MRVTGSVFFKELLTEIDKAPAGRDVIIVPSVPKKAPAKLVNKTVDSKPLFAPVVITPGKKP